MSRTQVYGLISMSAVDLADAEQPRLSLRRRYCCAFDAAARSARAFAGERGIEVSSDAEALRLVASEAPLLEKDVEETAFALRFHGREVDAFYQGLSTVDSQAVTRTIVWAQRMRRAALLALAEGSP